MADKLVAEFYSNRSDTQPFASVLVVHGGDNPASAASTLRHFLSDCFAEAGRKEVDIHLAAAQLVVWANRLLDDSGLGIAAFLVPNHGESPYQTARVYPSDRSLAVQIMRDEYSSESEFEDARLILAPFYIEKKDRTN